MNLDKRLVGIYAGMVAGMYAGFEYGVEKARRGKHDWVLLRFLHVYYAVL